MIMSVKGIYRLFLTSLEYTYIRHAF